MGGGGGGGGGWGVGGGIKDYHAIMYMHMYIP